MPSFRIGDRVCAIYSEDSELVEIFGYGEIEDMEVPYDAVGGNSDELVEYGVEDMVIRLDSGDIVYGCECFMVSEDYAANNFINKSVHLVNIQEIRDRYQE